MSFVLDGKTLSVADVHAIAHGDPVSLDAEARQRMIENVNSMPPGPSILEEKRHWLVGGFAAEMNEEELCRTFILGHCAGVGRPLPAPMVRATMAARANVLATATTGCRAEAAEILVEMLNADVVPPVPSQGSVGAAGDLAPLAYIARVACGYSDRPPQLPTTNPMQRKHWP